MAKNISIFFLGISIFYISACSVRDSENEKENDSFTLLITDSRVEIPIDAQTFPQSGCSYCFTSNSGINYLAYLNGKSNEIHFYYLDSAKIAFKVKIDIDGPNGIGSIMIGFGVHNLDSIYVTPKARKIIYLLNRSGEIIEKINYGEYTCNADTRDKINGMMAFYSRPGTPLIFLDNKVYISMLPAGNWNRFSKKELTKIELGYLLNSSQKSLHILPITYPVSAYLKNDLGYSRILGDGQFVYSFNSDDNLIIYENSGNASKYLAKSRYIKSIEEYPRNGSLQDYLLKQVSRPAYLRIIFDPYRKIYYRIAYPGFTVKRNDNLRELIRFIPQFSVIILDQDFNNVGETLMPFNKFDVSDIFVAREGLYISENHINNPDFRPDFLSFRLLKLVKNEK